MNCDSAEAHPLTLKRHKICFNISQERVCLGNAKDKESFGD